MSMQEQTNALNGIVRAIEEGIKAELDPQEIEDHILEGFANEGIHAIVNVNVVGRIPPASQRPGKAKKKKLNGDPRFGKVVDGPS